MIPKCHRCEPSVKSTMKESLLILVLIVILITVLCWAHAHIVNFKPKIGGIND